MTDDRTGQESLGAEGGPACRVDISFHSPEGFTETYVVDTANRGKAMRAVLDIYESDRSLKMLMPRFDAVTVRPCAPSADMISLREERGDRA